VLDAGGHPLALKRDERAAISRPEIATAKAAGCLGMGFGGRELARRAEAMPGFFAALNGIFPQGIIPLPGGVLIRDAAGVLLGAVGVSGDTSDNDEVCAGRGDQGGGAHSRHWRMKPIVFTNVRIFDGTGRGLFPGQVRVAANRIDAVAQGGERIEPAGADIIDGCGMTLMPGMVEGHAHLTWPSSVERVVNTMRLPLEEHLLVTAQNARITLDHGFTSAHSAGLARRALRSGVARHDRCRLPARPAAAGFVARERRRGCDGRPGLGTTRRMIATSRACANT
jgi:uncharacterized protein GlcG (DUF336 family)